MTVEVGVEVIFSIVAQIRNHDTILSWVVLVSSRQIKQSCLISAISIYRCRRKAGKHKSVMWSYWHPSYSRVHEYRHQSSLKAKM